MTMKIVVLDGYTLNPGDLDWKTLSALGEINVYDRTEASRIVERIGDAELILTNKTPISAETMKACGKLRYVGVLATGYNIVDVAAAKAAGIVVTNIPTYGTDAVAQFAFALLLEVCHHVGHHARTVRDGEWTTCPDFCYWRHPLIELAGKTMGLIGFGRIGRRTGEIARAFGMKVLAFDEYPNKAFEKDGISYTTLDRLLAESDVVSLHCPLTDKNKGMINRDSIAKMKDGAILINTSRGPLVDEEALAAALDSGKLAAAAVDVVSTEPIRADNPLLKARNALVTPHIAWAPKEARSRLLDIAVENLRAFVAGAPKNVVS
jgi:glycerate dehydrogenase